MMITTEGIIIQLRCDEISTYSRITSGVKLINLKKGETVAKIAKVRDEAMTSNDEDGDSVEAGEASTGKSEETTDEVVVDNVEEADSISDTETENTSDNE
jgi:DNA gyrase subunit A